MLIVIICSLIGGVLSLIGGLVLLVNKGLQQKVEYLTAFAGGTLLAAAFSDLLPEAIEQAADINLIIWSTLAGLLFFFVLETILTKFCGHDCEHQHHQHLLAVDSKVSLIVVGDTIHNFVDGVAIAAGFLISPLSGVITTLAVAAHEIPQEIGEFALLFGKKVRRRKIVAANLISSLATTVSAVVFYYLGSVTEVSVAPFLALVAGFFIYLAVSDIMPNINQEEAYGKRVGKVLILILSVVATSWLIIFLHGVSR